MHRPGEIADKLGISANTLRLWSNEFADFLSPSAQASRTEKGGASQRRYTDGDIEVLLRAKLYLSQNKTYEEVRSLLGQPPADGELSDSLALVAGQANEPVSPTSIATITNQMAFLEDYVRQGAKQNELLLEEVAGLRTEFSQLNENLVKLAEAAVIPPPAPKFRWAWLNRLLTTSTDAGT